MRARLTPGDSSRNYVGSGPPALACWPAARLYQPDPVRGLSCVIGVEWATPPDLPAPSRTRRTRWWRWPLRPDSDANTSPVSRWPDKGRHNQCRGQSCGHRPGRTLASRRVVTSRTQNTRQGCRSPSKAALTTTLMERGGMEHSLGSTDAPQSQLTIASRAPRSSARSGQRCPTLPG